MYADNHFLRFIRAESLRDDAAIFAEIVSTGQIVTFADLFADVERTASALIKAGLKPGDRVAAQTEKSIASLQLYLGTILAGAVYLPLNTAYTPGEVAYFLNDAAPVIFVCTPGAKAALLEVAQDASVAQVWTLSEEDDCDFAVAVRAETPGFTGVPRAPDDLAGIFYTSGTTGRSKGAMISHGAMVANAATLRDYWRFSSDDVLIHALPIFHIHGLFVAINVAMSAGASLKFMSGFDAQKIIALMPEASVLMGVPTFYTRLLSEPDLTSDAAKNMRLFTSGSAPLLSETHKQFRARTGQVILERYGMTETGINTSNPYEGERRAGTIGVPLPGIDLRIADADSGVEVARGEKGIIEVRSTSLFNGYWNMPEKTAEEFRDDGFFITGDIGFSEPDGYITLVGRAKDMIISGGFNVYPKEIEALIDALPGVKESAVFGVPHPDFGEAVTCVVVSRDDTSDVPSPDEIMAALRDEIANFKQPKHIEIIEALPRNAMGKVQKAVLQQRFENLFVQP